ncbi:MAG: ACP S-malonyltransferase [Desulfobacteraceae bacterium]|nr:MAG: ACP S-malonyltransferase [Desulfobacteraceae bacterium]
MKNKKIILVFPGQGSQYVGMGKELHEKFKIVRDIYDRADRVLGYKISEQCFKKPGFGKKIMHRTVLDKTIFTQPAVLTTSYACYKALEEKCEERNIDLNVSLLAGHSLGEYTALLISGVMDFETCLKLVAKRAFFMTELGKGYPGAGLMAIVDKKRNLNYKRICDLCKDFELYVTLNNTKKQIVIGGSKKKLAELSKELKKEGKLATILKVEGPFHTPIMRPAAEKLKKELEKSRLSIGSKPVIANVSTDAIVDPNHIRKELYEQIFKIVDWRGSVEKVIGNGGGLFIEVGPKRVLSNMIKDIDTSISCLNVEDVESLEKTVNELEKQTKDLSEDISQGESQ